MKTYRWAWRVAAAITALLAVAGTVVTAPLGPAIAIASALLLVGGIMGYAIGQDYPKIKHPILGGALLFCAPALYSGLSAIIGPAAIGVTAALLLASPIIVTQISKRLRPRISPPGVDAAGMAEVDEALRLQWLESTRQLDRATSVDDRMLMVDVRQQILDDLAERADGQLPDYVWITPQGHGGVGHSSHQPP